MPCFVQYIYKLQINCKVFATSLIGVVLFKSFSISFIMFNYSCKNDLISDKKTRNIYFYISILSMII